MIATSGFISVHILLSVSTNHLKKRNKKYAWAFSFPEEMYIVDRHGLSENVSPRLTFLQQKIARPKTLTGPFYTGNQGCFETWNLFSYLGDGVVMLRPPIFQEITAAAQNRKLSLVVRPRKSLGATRISIGAKRLPRASSPPGARLSQRIPTFTPYIFTIVGV